MSDEELSVECGEHGKSPATFVCQHLPAGENQGFNVGYDPEHPDDAYPDAWCDQCDAVLEQEGEWNERAEAFADIKMVCAGCYCEIRARNWRQDEDALVELISDSFDYLQARQADFMQTYGIGDYQRWDWYQENATLVFSNNGQPVLECAIDFVGSFSSRSNTWMWAWANDSLLEPVRSGSRAIRELGESLGLFPLACATWAAEPIDGWEMTAVMAKHLGAIGAYRTPSENGFMHMVVRQVRWLGER
ncbi:hypothetical protein HBN76_18590 [Pseudomonas sp. WS 5013]|uniref:DUF6882 domain-containing protein n=1 Tax=Pseudomonas sp. WS 5013 TaxID=2717475 RepID=UPI001474D4F7|nr:DUF6882 domain-containing protein [Pseudomonas sp. WS 5013]NMY43327.1 hypothetical protein [Pseudomonas sp. WS 5013]